LAAETFKHLDGSLSSRNAFVDRDAALESRLHVLSVAVGHELLSIDH